MKVLVVSDSHRDQETLEAITQKYKDLPLKIHCGDSDMPYDDPSICDYINVRGNHDQDERFPIYKIIQIDGQNALVIHGHLHHVWKNYDTMIQIAKEHQCKIIFHGHTHIPHVEIIDDIFILNPGSLMFNRGSYGYGSFAIVEITKATIDYHFYHHTDYNEVTDVVLPDGIALLEDLKKYIIE